MEIYTAQQDFDTLAHTLEQCSPAKALGASHVGFGRTTAAPAAETTHGWTDDGETTSC
jgi:hypothetical protein